MLVVGFGGLGDGGDCSCDGDINDGVCNGNGSAHVVVLVSGAMAGNHDQVEAMAGQSQAVLLALTLDGILHLHRAACSLGLPHLLPLGISTPVSHTPVCMRTVVLVGTTFNLITSEKTYFQIRPPEVRPGTLSRGRHSCQFSDKALRPWGGEPQGFADGLGCGPQVPTNAM